MSLITKIKLLIQSLKPFETPETIKLSQEIIGELNYADRERKDFHKR
jgi:hypothetical protein